MDFVTLNNGHEIAQLGLGVYKVGQDIAVDLVRLALDIGYRRIDTAALYDNEQEVGAAIRKSGLPREDVYVTTKIWNDRQGYENALEAIDESLQRLNIEYIDMLMIHWPAPAQNKYLETWSAFEKALETGKIHGIGVSNFQPHHLENLMAHAMITPAINQVELNPNFQQPEVRTANAALGIKTEAWSPLARARLNADATLNGLAEKHGKSVSQIILRWHLQIGNLVIPKSSNPDRLKENFEVFDFKLDAAELNEIAALDVAHRTGLNPDEFG